MPHWLPGSEVLFYSSALGHHTSTFSIFRATIFWCMPVPWSWANISPAMSPLGADWKAWHSNISLEELSHKKSKLNDYQNISMTFTSFYFFSLRVWIFQGWRCISKTAWVPHAWNQWLFDQDGAESNSLPRKMAFCPKCLCMSVSVQISVCFPFP